MSFHNISPTSESVLSLPFDQYQRYRMIVDVLDRLRIHSDLLILDVGGSPGTLQRFLQGDRVIVADPEANCDHSVCASGLALPFADASFDVVVSIDTIEHIPNVDRQSFLSELSRVSRNWLVLGAPFDDPAVVQAEEVLDWLIEGTYNERYYFLEEHRRFGLPKLEETLACLREGGFDTIVLSNGYLYRWLLGLSFFFLIHWRLPHLKSLDSFNAFYNSYFYRSDNREPSYRRIIVGAKDGAISSLNFEDLVAEPADDHEDVTTALLQPLGLLLQAINLEVLVSDSTGARRDLLKQDEQLLQGLQSLRAEIERLRAQIERQRSDNDRQRGEIERLRAQIERQQCESEHQWAEIERQRLMTRDLRDQNTYLTETVRRLQEEVAARERIIQGIQAGRIWRLATPIFSLHHMLQRASSTGKGLARRVFTPQQANGSVRSGANGAGSSNELVAGNPKKNGSLDFVEHRPQNYDILCFSILEWDFGFQRPHQMAAQFAEQGHRVFYMSLARSCPPDEPAGYTLRQLGERIYEVHIASHNSTNVYGLELTEDRVAALFASLDSLRLEQNIVSPVLLVQLPFWRPLVLRLRQRFGWKIVYDCMDQWDGFPGWDTDVINLEPKLVDECDLLLTSAQKLSDKWVDRKGDRCILVRNAANFDHFWRAQPNSLLEDMKDIKHPVVGYFGAIAEWFDTDLLVFLARSRPNHSFVLLGWTSPAMDIGQFDDFPNIHFLGRKSYDILPQYLHHFDACIIPFLVNHTTEPVDPVKFYEYVSLGKPVVAVSMPELYYYKEYLYIAEDRQDFLAKLDLALSESNPEIRQRRIELARQNTWEARVNLIKDELKRVHGRASIIVVTYNNLEFTRQCIDSVMRNSLWPDHEIIVVDNASADGTSSYLQNLERTNHHVKAILNSENLGFARANNQGLAIATGDYLVILNNDTIAPNGWLPRLIHHLERDPEIGLIGPVTSFSGNETKIDVSYDGVDGIEEFAEKYVTTHEGKLFDIEMLPMHCVAFRRSVLEQVGNLDERFEVGMFEDDDYSRRVRLAGYRVVCAEDVFIHHFGKSSFAKLSTEAYQEVFERNKRRFEEKWGIEWTAHRHRSSV